MTGPDIQFKFRLPAELKATLEGLAEKSGRTLSAEMVHRLQQAVHYSDKTDEGIERVHAELAGLAAAVRRIADLPPEQQARVIMGLDEKRKQKKSDGD